jgi:hypothetical protein
MAGRKRLLAAIVLGCFCLGPSEAGSEVRIEWVGDCSQTPSACAACAGYTGRLIARDFPSGTVYPWSLTALSPSGDLEFPTFYFPDGSVGFTFSAIGEYTIQCYATDAGGNPVSALLPVAAAPAKVIVVRGWSNQTWLKGWRDSYVFEKHAQAAAARLSERGWDVRLVEDPDAATLEFELGQPCVKALYANTHGLASEGLLLKDQTPNGHFLNPEELAQMLQRSGATIEHFTLIACEQNMSLDAWLQALGPPGTADVTGCSNYDPRGNCESTQELKALNNNHHGLWDPLVPISVPQAAARAGGEVASECIDGTWWSYPDMALSFDPYATLACATADAAVANGWSQMSAPDGAWTIRFQYPGVPTGNAFASAVQWQNVPGTEPPGTRLGLVLFGGYETAPTFSLPAAIEVTLRYDALMLQQKAIGDLSQLGVTYYNGMDETPTPIPWTINTVDSTITCIVPAAGSVIVSRVTGTTAVGRPSIGEGPRLTAWPNPFHSGCTVELQLARPAALTLSLVDAQGRIVRRIVRGDVSAGRHTYRIENNVGDLAPGVYWIVAKTGDAQRSRIVVLR